MPRLMRSDVISGLKMDLLVIFMIQRLQRVASYYIIQNVGSVLENDNQQGLALFRAYGI
jgi:hypothetical protein